MQTFKRILKALAVLAFAGIVNYALCMAIVPYGSKSEVMWTDFRQTEDLDMVFMGTSLVERSINPNIIDDALGTSSFNMATPSQTFEDSYLGLEEAIKKHHIKRAFLGVEFGDLNRKNSTKSGVYVREKARGESISEAFHDWTTSIDLDTWLNDSTAFSMLFFPWQIQHVAPSKIKHNLKMRIDGTSVYDAAKYNEQGWDYYGKGFGGYTKTYNFVAAPARYYVNDYKLKDLTAPDADRLEVLARYCNLCKENGIECIIFVNPLADYHMVSFGEKYAEISGWLKDFALSQGASYWDFNLAKPELLDVKNSYYSDYQHMNVDGANALSASFATLIKCLDEGQSTDDFFGTYDERVARVNSVASANFTSVTCTEHTIEMKATSVVGPGVKAEYQFSVRYVEDEEEYAVVQEYSSSPKCSFVPTKRGLYHVRVDVREAGAEKAKINTSRKVVF